MLATMETTTVAKERQNCVYLVSGTLQLLLRWRRAAYSFPCCFNRRKPTLKVRVESPSFFFFAFVSLCSVQLNSV